MTAICFPTAFIHINNLKPEIKTPALNGCLHGGSISEMCKNTKGEVKAHQNYNTLSSNLKARKVGPNTYMY
jgi:hypothetical protein